MLPVSSASCERSFSTLKLVKTHVRSTMSDSRLSNLAVLSIESERSKALDIDAFIKRFSAVTAKFSSSKLMYRERVNSYCFPCLTICLTYVTRFS